MPLAFVALLISGSAGVDPDDAPLTAPPPILTAHADDVQSTKPAGPPYDGAIACGIGASLGAIGGALVGGSAVAVFAYSGGVATMFAGAGANPNATATAGLEVALVAVPLATLGGATAVAAYGGDPEHALASAIAGGVGGAAGLALIGVGATAIIIGQKLPGQNALSPILDVAGVAAGAASIPAVGITAGLLAPALAE